MLPDWVGSYIGIPYEDHGRGRCGCDCWGLVRMVLAEQRGIELPCYGTEYASEDDHAAVGAAMSAAQGGWAPVDDGHEQPFDVAQLTLPIRTPAGWRYEPLHVGIVVMPGVLLHVERATAALLAKYRDGAPMQRRLSGFWRRA